MSTTVSWQRQLLGATALRCADGREAIAVWSTPSSTEHLCAVCDEYRLRAAIEQAEAEDRADAAAWRRAYRNR